MKKIISLLRQWRFGSCSKAEPVLKVEPVFNGHQPRVVVDCADGDDDCRGDVHGRIGLARCVAGLLGAKYTEITRDQCPDGSRECLKSLIAGEDAPDFVFTRQFLSLPLVDFAVQESAAGLVISSFSENLTKSIAFNDPLKDELVPHHLNKQIVDWERDAFAREYAELPRPLIGVLMTYSFSLYPYDIVLPAMKSIQQTVQAGGTVFLCSSRHCGDEFPGFSNFFREGIGPSAVFVDFHLNARRRNDDEGAIWNPYVGLLAEADHLVVLGPSKSILSEAVSMGRTVHKLGPRHEFPRLIDGGYLLNIDATAPLQTKSIEPVGINEALAQALVAYHAEVVPAIRRGEKRPDVLSNSLTRLGRYPTI